MQCRVGEAHGCYTVRVRGKAGGQPQHGDVVELAAEREVGVDFYLGDGEGVAFVDGVGAQSNQEGGCWPEEEVQIQLMESSIKEILHLIFMNVE